MPWYALWSDVIKKKVCRYLLQRYLGQFLQEKLSLEQLNVDLYNGKGTVYDVALYSEALNELCQSQGWALEVIEGYLGSVTVNIPWNALMTEDSFIEVSGLYLALKPKPTAKEGQSVLESMWSSMSSSMQLAQDCMDRDGENLAQNVQMSAMEGIERFAQIIDNVLNRIKAKFVDTVVRLEYVLPNQQRGIAIVVKIKKIEYQNEVGGDTQESGENSGQNPAQDNEGSPSASRKKSYFISTHAIHHIVFEDITFYTEEFLLVDETRVGRGQSRAPSEPMGDISEQFHSTISSMSSTMQDSRETFLSEDRDETTGEEDDDSGVRIVTSGEILMGRLRMRQEVRIRMKQSETVPGPKVEMDLNLGCMELFLSPRQVHLLVCVSERFTGEATTAAAAEDVGGVDKQATRQVPVANVALSTGTQTPFNPMSGGWSSNIHDDPSKSHQQIFYSIAEPQNPIGGNIFDSVMSSSSSMTSSMSSATTSGKKGSGLDVDNSMISRFAMRIASILVIILHEDILFESALDQQQCLPLTADSVDKMKVMSEGLFRKLQEMDYDADNFEECLNGVMTDHHLRLWLSPVIVEGDEQRNLKENLMQISISVACGHFMEILTDLAVPLLDFHREESSVVGSLARRPDIVVNVHKLEKIRHRGGAVRYSLPTTTINCTLACCHTEIDISMYDRLKAVLDDTPFDGVSSHIVDYRTSAKESTQATTTTLVVTSQCADVKLRFPIPDLRPLHDPQRVPWWRRNVRPDSLTLRLHGLRLTNVATDGYKVEAREIHVFYCENDRAPSIAVGRCSQRLDDATQMIDIPTVLVEVIPEESDTTNLLDRLERESPTDSAQKKPNPTPFSSKRVCRESDTPHKKNPNDDTETLIIPGDSAEMSTFCDFAYKNSRLRIKINLPLVSLQLRSKHLYEILYNRINSDLLLWEPAARSATVPQQTIDNFLNIGMMDSIYAPATSIRAMASDYSATNSSESSDSAEEEDANVFYSMYDRKKTRMPERHVEGTKSCDLCIQVSITEGLLTMQAPVRDSKNLVIPEQFGEYVIRVDGLSLFTVKGYCGNENLGFVCLEVVDADLYHCGIIPSPNSDPPLRWFDSILPEYLLKTIYSTPKDLTMQKGRRDKEREMISLAIQIKHCPEQRLKRIRVAAGIEMATLRHNPSQPEHTWLTELLDMFDVVDYPVLGYTVSGVVTEMHLHLWDCAIDYRPIYFPYRAVITLGNFMISSNITTTAPGCTLRFVAEDCTLSLAPQAVDTPAKDMLESDYPKIPENLHGDSRDLVCIVDLGLFEISLRLNEKATSYAPKFDMRAAINDVHIRTCADSARALAQLISYIAAQGDLDKFDAAPEESCDSTGNLSEADADLLSVKSSQTSIPEVTQTQQQHVNTLMAEAMQESAIEESEYSDEDIGALGPGVDVFFFPDEAAKMGVSSKQSLPGSTPDSVSITSGEIRELYDFESTVMGGGASNIDPEIDIEVEEALPQVAKDLGNVRRRDITPSKSHQHRGIGHLRSLSSGTDDDFCFISEEERVIFCGQNEVTVTEDPIRIVDNHFSVPNRKPDLLQAPHDFPMAVIRYTLCEMSVTWHIFGGSDFSVNPPPEPKEDTLTEDESYRLSYLPMSDVYKYGVSYAAGAKTMADGSARRHQPTGKLSWKMRGGAHRRHDILMEFQLHKVRFSHEVYPSDREQASRQVLLVSDLEIKDKLAVSNINKFLYHPTSGVIKPHQSRANLLVIKALHLRSDLSLPAQECCLRVSMLPLRLNIDQDSLLFLFDFFQEFSGADSTPPVPESQRQVPTSMSPPPIMMVDLPEAAQELQARKMVSENLMLLMEDEGEKSTTPTTADTEDNSPIYFRSVSFSPEVKIRIDYQGKRVELSRGPLAGLLMGLGQLHCSEIRLKRICHKNGILGVDKLLNFLLQEWLQDIKRNQLPSLLGGVGPMHSFIQLFQGIRDLFWLPIEQYQKDGQIVRGLQRGAQSFTARTALAALEITTRLIHLLQITAETAYDMVSPGPTVRRVRGYKKSKRKRVQPPQDIREGVANAYQIVRDGIGETVHTIMEVAALEHDQKGYTGAVGAVVREIPSTMVKPIVLATQATTNVLGGVRNQLVPDARIEAREKWKEDED
uniref:Autophagy-related protein 2 n=1 Tax=Phlebotomus kandelakii TaxID=1109342 RepID=A0A6B2EBD1_9DIPT